MNARRRARGDETWNRLLNWADSQKASERLAGHILAVEGFESIDPSNPLGGRDGLKDLICSRNNLRWVAAVYFPNGEYSFNDIRGKFENDIRGVARNEADAFVFVTNQYLTVGEREKLEGSAPIEHVEIYHLERIARILDTPHCYGIRLEFLDIEMTKEEQVSFFQAVTERMDELRNYATSFLKLLSDNKLSDGIPIDELREFANILYRMVGDPSSYLISPFQNPIHRLHVPVDELREFATILYRMVGDPSSYLISPFQNPIHRLHVPVDEIREYEQTLDRILLKIEKMRELNQK